MHNPFEQLDKSTFSFESKPPTTEKLSQKPMDIMSRQVLEQHQELKEKITNALESLERLNSKIPLVHITSRGILELSLSSDSRALVIFSFNS